MPKGIYDRVTSQNKKGIQTNVDLIVEEPKRLAHQNLERMLQSADKRKKVQVVMRNLLHYWEMGMQPVQTDVELEERLMQFFMSCAENQSIPTVEKMCLAIGYNRKTVWAWGDGKPSSLGYRTQQIIEKARQIMESFDAELLMENSINPVSYIFRAKNYYGLVDRQEHVLPSQNSLCNPVDPATIAASLPEE